MVAIIISALIMIAEVVIGILTLCSIISYNVGGIIILALIGVGVIFDIIAALVITRRMIKRRYVFYL